MDLTQFNVIKPVIFTGGEDSINYWLKTGWKIISIVSYHREQEQQATTTVIFGKIDKHKLRHKIR
jgi:hypothetical protein